MIHLQQGVNDWLQAVDRMPPKTLVKSVTVLKQLALYPANELARPIVGSFCTLFQIAREAQGLNVGDVIAPPFDNRYHMIRCKLHVITAAAQTLVAVMITECLKFCGRETSSSPLFGPSVVNIRPNFRLIFPLPSGYPVVFSVRVFLSPPTLYKVYLFGVLLPIFTSISNFLVMVVSIMFVGAGTGASLALRLAPVLLILVAGKLICGFFALALGASLEDTCHVDLHNRLTAAPVVSSNAGLLHEWNYTPFMGGCQ